MLFLMLFSRIKAAKLTNRKKWGEKKDVSRHPVHQSAKSKACCYIVFLLRKCEKMLLMHLSRSKEDNCNVCCVLQVSGVIKKLQLSRYEVFV